MQNKFNFSLVRSISRMFKLCLYLRKEFSLGDKSIQRDVLDAKYHDCYWKLSAVEFNNSNFDAVNRNLFRGDDS